MQGHGTGAEGASERQTFSSIESLASLTATDGPEVNPASHGSQPGRAPLGVSPLGKAEGAGYAASRMANGSMGYPQHLQGGLPGVPSLLQSIWNAAPAWDACGQPAAQHLPSKPAQRHPGTAAERETVQNIPPSKPSVHDAFDSIKRKYYLSDGPRFDRAHVCCSGTCTHLTACVS